MPSDKSSDKTSDDSRDNYDAAPIGPHGPRHPEPPIPALVPDPASNPTPDIDTQTATETPARPKPTSTPGAMQGKGEGSSAIVALKRSRKAWRLSVTLLVFGILTAGQLIHTNDWFPLGSLSQYSYGRPLDAPTRAIRVMATNTDGEEVRVPLSIQGSGVQRAELEGQLSRILADPSILEAIARSWHGLHPDKPQFLELRLERTTHYIKGGVPTGESDTELLTTWTVAGDYQQETK